MIEKLKHTLALNLRNIPGWHTKRKIVVIESDDWGSIRMPSKGVYDKLLKSKIRVDKCPYNRFDSLASEEDLTELFGLLKQFKDQNGTHPVLTANTIVANPDFEKIRLSGYKEYHYELFTETLKRYPDHAGSFELWKQGMREGLFFPQFHGREHLNIKRWMRGLQGHLPETHLAFDNSLFGISTDITSEKRRSYLAALDFDEISELDDQKSVLIDGLNQFEKIFGYRSESFIATNYVWSSSLESVLAEAGIKYLQGSFLQREPLGNNRPYLLKKHRLGELNASGQIYLNRNCNFEPTLEKYNNSVRNCIDEIAIAFRWEKPAIISSHRLNYIGSIVPGNRIRNLKFLSELLQEIVKKWPQVEFMTSVQLGDFITREIK